MTVSKSSQVRVKRKGQVTIPSVIRARLGIEEGSLLEVEEQRGAIVLKPAPPLKGGRLWAKRRISRSFVNSTSCGETGDDRRSRHPLVAHIGVST